MKKLGTVMVLLISMMLVFACNGDTTTPTEPPLPTDTPIEPPTSTEGPPPEPSPTYTLPPPTFTPTMEPSVTPTTPTGTAVIIRFIQMIDGAMGWGIGSIPGDNNHVLLTMDGGSVWNDVTPPEPGLASKHAVGYFFDYYTGLVTYFPTTEAMSHNFYTWKTTNGGSSWTQSTTQTLDISSSESIPPYIDFVSANTGWILLRHSAAGMHSYPAYLMKTTNGGASWTNLTSIHSCNKTGMDFVDVSTGWLTYNNCPVLGARVSITTDGGSTWNNILLPEPTGVTGLFTSASCYSHSPNLLSSTTGAVILSCMIGGDPTNTADYLYVTNNGGASWITVEYPGGPLYALDTATMYAMGREQHRSTDGGVNWTPTSIVAWDGQFSFVTPLYIWGAAEASGSYALVKSINGTSSWAMLSPVVVP
ncbi:MAG TPA: hypothetical protein G4O08_04910 [Anaerolineae bacterium]|nr:hypothetical protein [Anaerolineae bacterium]